jgi:hypothetical protein
MPRARVAPSRATRPDGLRSAAATSPRTKRAPFESFVLSDPRPEHPEVYNIRSRVPGCLDTMITGIHNPSAPLLTSRRTACVATSTRCARRPRRRPKKPGRPMLGASSVGAPRTPFAFLNVLAAPASTSRAAPRRYCHARPQSAPSRPRRGHSHPLRGGGQTTATRSPRRLPSKRASRSGTRRGNKARAPMNGGSSTA